MSRFAVSFVWVLFVASMKFACSQDADVSAPPATTLERFPPLSIQQAMESFKVADGFRMELVAAEPLVVDPVAFCFDASGRLLVVEMRGYSERPDDQMGRLRRLTDTDKDGHMDHVETLAEGLSWPTAVECWGDGIVVATAPELIYFSEDGSERKTLCEGFGKSNVQGLVNSLRYGLDLRLHGATSSSGAQIVGLGHDTPLRIGGRDFAIDTLAYELQMVDGGGQHGMTLDAWGDKYVCSNSDHLQQVIMLESRAHRASRTSFEPARRLSIAADGPQAEVYRTSPVEPWRILRTHLRVTGQASGPIEGGGRAAGYFTGATGIWLYEDDQWPQTEYPMVLVCDVGSNLVHRKNLLPNGLFNRGERIDQRSELVTSTDTWFRPVQLGCGPDGALYIADMYREVIEHPKSLPPVIKSQVDLNSGNDRGRIWRLVSTERTLKRAFPSLTEQSNMELIASIDCKNAWQRRTAARLLLQRDAKDDADKLGNIVSSGKYPEGRLQALSLLNVLTLKAGSVADTQLRQCFTSSIQSALVDQHPRIRQHAIEYYAQNATWLPKLDLQILSKLARDPSLNVRFQFATDCAALVPADASRADLLASVAEKDSGNEYIRWAVEGSLLNAADEFLKLQLAPEYRDQIGSQEWLQGTLFQILKGEPRDNSSSQVASLLEIIKSISKPSTDSELYDAFWKALPDAVAQSSRDGDNEQIVNWISESILPAIKSSIETGMFESPRFAAKLGLVRWAFPKDSAELLKKSLISQNPTWVQLAAIEKLAGFDQASVEIVGNALKRLTPEVQAAAIQKLSKSKEGQSWLLRAVLTKELKRDSLPQPIWAAWTQDALISRQLDEAGIGTAVPYSAKNVDRLIEDYSKRMTENGIVEKGQQIFKKNCAVCHLTGADGKQVGPELKSILEKSKEQILISILDPNREVDPKYRSVIVLTDYGKLVSGIISQETDQQLRLVDVQGNVHNVSREEIVSLETTSKSLMPEGFQDSITPAEMNDLITYLRTSMKERSK